MAEGNSMVDDGSWMGDARDAGEAAGRRVSWWECIDEHSPELSPGRNSINKVPLSTWSLHGLKTSRGGLEVSHSEPQLADFSNAAQVTLEAAQRSLVSEHRRMLAAREAVLCREIAQLRQELSKLRTDPSAQDEVVQVDCPTDLTRDYDAARTLKGSSEQRCTSPGFSVLGLDSADKRRSDSTYRVSSLAWDSVERVNTRRSDAVHFRPSSASVAQSPPIEGSSMKRTSCKSAASVASSSSASAMAYQSTWKRTADTVIFRAGMEFLGDGGPDGESRSISSWIRPRGERPWHAWVMETIIGFVIVLNTITLGISTEVRPQWTGWIAFDMFFGAVFSAEFLLKVCVIGCKGYFFGPDCRWNNFEVMLVLLAWVEISLAMLAEETDMSKSMLFRMMRLLRLAKLARILRLQVFCELLMIINGATSSWKTLLYSMVLICMPLYGVALLLKDMLAESNGRGAENFEQLQLAFFTVFRCFVANDCTQDDGKPLFLLVTKEYGFIYGVLYCLVQFLMTFGLFNVIVAIYVENTVSAARFNDLFVKRERLRDRKYFEHKAQNLLKMIWNAYYKNDPEIEELEAFNLEAAGKLNLSQEFFEELCAKRDFVDILRDLDISEDDQRDLFETLDVEGRGCIDLTDLIMGIGKLRGQARKADVVSMGLLLRSLQHKLLLINSKMSRNLRTPTATTSSQSMCLFQSHERSAGTTGNEGKRPLPALT